MGTALVVRDATVPAGSWLHILRLTLEISMSLWAGSGLVAAEQSDRVFELCPHSGEVTFGHRGPSVTENVGVRVGGLRLGTLGGLWAAGFVGVGVGALWDGATWGVTVKGGTFLYTARKQMFSSAWSRPTSRLLWNIHLLHFSHNNENTFKGKW